MDRSPIPFKDPMVVVVSAGSSDERLLSRLVKAAWGGPPVAGRGILLLGAHEWEELDRARLLHPRASVVWMPAAASIGFTQGGDVIVPHRPKIQGRSADWDWLLRSPVQWTNHPKTGPAVSWFDDSIGARVLIYPPNASWLPPLHRPHRSARTDREWMGRAFASRPRAEEEAAREEWLAEDALGF